MVSDDTKAVANASGSGIGFFGMLIILGILGMGPCADDCSGCGPTLNDVLPRCDCCEVGD